MSSKQTVIVVDNPIEREPPVFIKFVKLKKIGLQHLPFPIKNYEFCFGHKIGCAILYLDTLD